MTEKEKFFAKIEKKTGKRFCEESSYQGYGREFAQDLEGAFMRALEGQRDKKQSENLIMDLFLRNIRGYEGQIIHLIPISQVTEKGFDMKDISPQLIFGYWNGFERDYHYYFPVKDLEKEEIYDAYTLVKILQDD